MVISYEIYETSLLQVLKISYEITTSVRFCLSYDPLKRDFIMFRWNCMSVRTCIINTDIVNDVNLQVPKCYYVHMWSYDFYDMTLSTE